MCRFISMAFEYKEEAKRIFGGYKVWDNENQAFNLEVPTDYASLWITDGHCSCCYYTYPYDPEKDADKLRKRYRKKKKGWSAERIEQEVAKTISSRNKENGGLSDPLFACIKDYVREAGPCYFHIGWFSGDQTKQGIKFRGRQAQTLATGEFGAENVLEDVLYRFS